MLNPRLHASFLDLHLRVSRLSRPGRALYRSKTVIFLVDILCAEAIEAVKSRATLLASSPKLIQILGEINSDARL
jgi:hypothetical protein